MTLSNQEHGLFNNQARILASQEDASERPGRREAESPGSYPVSSEGPGSILGAEWDAVVNVHLRGEYGWFPQR